MLSIEISPIIATSRPSFLILTPCCLLIALAYAVTEQIPVVYPQLVLLFIGAIAAHISVNMFNEYQDFSSGLDFHTQRTPFSGGSGTLQAMPELAESVKIAAIGSLLLMVSIGCYFIRLRGWGLFPVGITGVLLIYFYTHKITHWPVLCLVAPGLAFGPLMIGGAYYALSGHYSAAVFFVSLIMFFLVNNLLLLNQFPDAEADKNAGRCHLPILIGRKKSAWVYAGFLAAAYSVLVLSVSLSFLPVYSLLGLLSLLWAIPAAAMAIHYADDMDKLESALALNVLITLATPVLVASGIILQSLL
ncbi:MAG: prenyltransferase [Gammaproteobacteria bacterium]